MTGRSPLSAAQQSGAIEIARSAGCVLATLSRRAAHNRLSAAMARELIELAEEVEDDEPTRMLAITGAGTTFCAGFDPDVDPRVVESLAAVSKPTVAIINGDALDEGLELAMGLDIRVAEAKARLGLTQLKYGRMPRFGGTQRLPRLIGAGEALRMLLGGTTVEGRDAMRLGLVTYLARGRRELSRVASELTEAILARGPLATRLLKEAVIKGYDMTLEQGIRLEEDLYALLQTTADRAEGVRAFLERRKPLFKGV
ncbi:MAG: enoyl-CoA hydratase-related protein [Candidatus Binataceae bacterium]